MKKKAKQKKAEVGAQRDAAQLRAADALEAKAVKGQKGAPRARAQAAAMRREIEARVTGRKEAHALRQSITERAALEARRSGEGVLVKDGDAFRIKNRDGLKSMHSAGGLTDAQNLAGTAFRQCFEAGGKGLRVAKYGDTPQGGQADGDLAALQHSYLMARLAQFERAIGDEVTLLIVEMVAGHGHTIASIASGGHGREVATRALKAGLDAIAAVLPVRPRTRPLAESGS